MALKGVNGNLCGLGGSAVWPIGHVGTVLASVNLARAKAFVQSVVSVRRTARVQATREYSEPCMRVCCQCIPYVEHATALLGCVVAGVFVRPLGGVCDEIPICGSPQQHARE